MRGPLLLVLLACTACKGGAPPSLGTPTLEEEMRDALDAVSTDAPFTLLVRADDDTEFSHSRGASTATTSYRSASTSKMVTAAVVLNLVRTGTLSLDDHPQDYVDFWPTTGDHADIELRHLLSFTSGLTEEPLCVNLPGASFENCVESILMANGSISIPGAEYSYGSSHMQVAGLMAIEAAGAADWTEVFDGFKTDTGLFPTAVYDLPSATNPRLAGGMHWRATEYLDFLDAIHDGRILTPTLIAEMTSDQIASATIVYSPVEAGSLGLDWHYGFGLWIECAAVPFDCPSVTRVSSAGAYGAYPFIDLEDGYVGIVAREGALGTGDEGYRVYESVADELVDWAEQHR